MKIYCTKWTYKRQKNSALIAGIYLKNTAICGINEGTPVNCRLILLLHIFINVIRCGICLSGINSIFLFYKLHLHNKKNNSAEFA